MATGEVLSQTNHTGPAGSWFPDFVLGELFPRSSSSLPMLLNPSNNSTSTYVWDIWRQSRTENAKKELVLISALAGFVFPPDIPGGPHHILQTISPSNKNRTPLAGGTRMGRGMSEAGVT